jgi:GDP-4-dehydro-6-deoxy-D-mannose reductase
MPLDESAELLPANPYAASKAAAEAIALAWARSYDLDVIVARPFNHIGPGQDQRFVVASFAQQLATIAAGGPPLLHVGNLKAERDFLDVRDVAEAYIALLAYGRGGEVYNICSGRSVRIQEVLRQLIAIARVPVEVREDPERMRPSDLPVLVGYASKLRTATGWEPKRSLAQTLRDVYADAQTRLGAVSA